MKKTVNKALRDAFGVDEGGRVDLPQRMGSARIARIVVTADESSCGFCFPHGFERPNATVKKNNRSWKRNRLARFVPMEEAAREHLRADSEIRRAEVAIAPGISVGEINYVGIDDLDTPRVAVYVEAAVPLTPEEVPTKVEQAPAAGGLAWSDSTLMVWS